MIFDRLKSRDGFTLVELLLFSVIFALVTMAFIGIFVVMTRIQSRENSNISLIQESQFLLQKVQVLIQQSSLIEMTADVSMTTIKLRMASSVSDPTYIYVTNSQAFLRETDSGSPQPLTSDRVALSNVSFIKRSNPRGYDSIKISFTISPTASSTQSSPQAISTSIGRTSPAVFDSNLQSPSGQPINLGVASEDIDSINRTLVFRGGNMGIGANGEAPKERLQIDDGGLKFSNLPTRPTCIEALRGTLWFRQDDTDGDSLAMCMKSATGPYYWTQYGVAGSSTASIDTIGANVGLYNSIVTTPSDRRYAFTSFYDENGRRLKFNSSINGGTSWATNGGSVVDDKSSINVGLYNSIAAPTTSTLYISYYDTVNNNLRLAKSTNGGSTWATSTVAASGNGQYSGIAAPSSSVVYISYYDATNNDLMVASSSNGGQNWSYSRVDSGGDVGQYTAIATPQSDTIYVCYYDNSNNLPKFAWSTNSGGTWATSTIDSGFTGGAPCSISAPTVNSIFITYYTDTAGASNGSLKMRRSVSGPTGFDAPFFIDSRVGEGRWSGVASVDGQEVFVAYHSFIGGNHYLSQAFSQLAGAAGTWSTSTPAFD
ncbi:MAG: hypothetical protein AAB903_02580, partial [Patescibacteria group bacterium]